MPKQVKGSKHYEAKLNEVRVRLIRAMLEHGDATGDWIADFYGVGRTTIADVKSGRNWKHVTRGGPWEVY